MKLTRLRERQKGTKQGEGEHERRGLRHGGGKETAAGCGEGK